MFGVELRTAECGPATELALKVVTGLLKRGILLLPDAPAGNVLAFTPPFEISSDEVDHCIREICCLLAS